MARYETERNKTMQNRFSCLAIIYCAEYRWANSNHSLKSNGKQEVTDSNRFVLSKYRFQIVFVCYLQCKILELKNRRNENNGLNWFMSHFCLLFISPRKQGTINTVVLNL